MPHKEDITKDRQNMVLYQYGSGINLPQRWVSYVRYEVLSCGLIMVKEEKKMRRIPSWQIQQVTTLVVLLAISNLTVSQENNGLEVFLKAAVVSMDAKLDKAANLETYATYIEKASQMGAHLVVFPEFSLQQNPGRGVSNYQPTEEQLRYMQETAETVPGPSTDAVVVMAKTHRISVVFGMSEKSLDGELYNTSVFLGPDGIFGSYRKRHLADASVGMNEHLLYRRGTESGLVASRLGNVGLMVCADMLVEFGKELAQQGADFLVTVSAWPAGDGSRYGRRVTHHAREARLWHIVADQVGPGGRFLDYGHSQIVNPYGVVVADTGAIEGIVVAETEIMLPPPVVDFNGDGIVDAIDMCIMVDHWSEDYPLCDISPTPFGDGVVNVQDLKALAEHLFTYPDAVAYWMLDETEGDIAYDSIGGCNGTLFGDPVWRNTSGMADGAIQFDGIDDYVCTDFVLNPADGVFSVVTWIKGGAPGQVILSQESGANWLMADLVDGALKTDLREPGTKTGRNPIPPGPPLVSSTIFTDDDWRRIGIVWDGSYRHLYIDGVEVAMDTAPLSDLESAEGGLYFGAGSSLAPGTFFYGLIDDIRIYNRVVIP